MKYVPSTVGVNIHGRYVTRGYTEISGVRIYDDQVVVGPHGEYQISPGYTEEQPQDKKKTLSW